MKKLTLLLLCLVLSAQMGCSLFSGGKGGKAGGSGKSTASKKFESQGEEEALSSVPADIAHDIGIIKSGGSLPPSKRWTLQTDQLPANNRSAGEGTQSRVSAINTESEEGNLDGAQIAAEAGGAGVSIEPGTEPPVAPQRNPAGDGTPWVRPDGPSETYTIREGDTLMHIAFEKYGNVYRWRDIYNANRDLIADYNRPIPGTVITIYGVQYFVLEKNGEPYLIRWGDSLVKISKKLYGDPQYWDDLWHNNKRLIRNPDQIFAGFTLYYPEKEKFPKR